MAFTVIDPVMAIPTISTPRQSMMALDFVIAELKCYYVILFVNPYCQIDLIVEEPTPSALTLVLADVLYLV